jgi:hypothetical protein
MSTERDMSRLPKWAQDRITLLERNLADARARLAAGPEESDTFADPYMESVRPLGSGTRVRFGGRGYDGTFDVSWGDGELAIQCNSGGRSMAIMPQASNTVHMSVVAARKVGR